MSYDMNTTLDHRRVDKSGAGMLAIPALYMLVYCSITEADRLPWHKLTAQIAKCGVTLQDMQIMHDLGWVSLQQSQSKKMVISITPAGNEVVRNLVTFFQMGGQGYEG